MRLGINFRSDRKSVHGFGVATETGVGFRDVPQNGSVARIELLCFFEVLDGVFPAALATGDGARGFPRFGIARSDVLRDRHLGPGQLVIAVAIVIVVGEREPRLTRIRAQAQCRIGRDFRQRQALPRSIVSKPIQLAVEP